VIVRSTQPVRTARAGFTLLEVLVVISVIAILVAVMLPAMSACRRAARNLKCTSQLRTVAIEFRFFADDFAAQRGASDAYGEKLFNVVDFVDSLYRVGTFWDQPDTTPTTYVPGRESMMCPEGPGLLKRKPALPCNQGGVWPAANVSVAVNMRLYRATEIRGGRPVLEPKLVGSNILEHPNVPLALDGDGEAADSKGETAYFTAPPTGNPDHYAAGRYWFPSYRHGERLNVALLDGSVHATHDPLAEPGWNWTYQPK